jgi:hypothetical protein
MAADAKVVSLTCVGLMSETGDGNISWRTGKADWTVVKLGDVIPLAAELKISVDRDWIELTPTNDPTKVYDLEGTEKELIIKATDILKGKVRTVAFPKKSDTTDPAFKDKMVVSQVMGRQIYRASPSTSDKDIQYGDVLDVKGKVRIIGINNTLNLMFPNGAVTTVIGPLNFEVQKVMSGSNLYKYLNVGK